LGWFLSGTLVGPAFGPLIGGVIVTFKSWRVIFWLQSALAGTSVFLIAFLLPETIHYKKSTELKGLTTRQYTKQLGKWVNPIRVLVLYRYPNLLAAVSNKISGHVKFRSD
jgi:MFS family permease